MVEILNRLKKLLHLLSYLNVNLSELLLGDLRRRSQKQILRVGVKRESDDLANAFLAGQKHYHSVHARRHSRVGRGAEFESVVKRAEEILANALRLSTVITRAKSKSDAEYLAEAREWIGADLGKPSDGG